MAERRMFAKTIVTSDAFLDMPPTARCLYFTLAMFADDDGFVNNPKSIMRQVSSTTDDMNILIAKRFVLVFESGVIVIKHWKIHNYIQSDRYHPTKYQEEKAQLSLDENKVYTQMDTPCIQDVSITDTEVRLGKVRLGKDIDTYGSGPSATEPAVSDDTESLISESDKKKSKKPVRHRHGEYQHVLLTDEQYQNLTDEYGDQVAEEAIRVVDEYCELSGKTYKNYNIAIKNWGIERAQQNLRKAGRTGSKSGSGNPFLDMLQEGRC